MEKITITKGTEAWQKIFRPAENNTNTRLYPERIHAAGNLERALLDPGHLRIFITGTRTPSPQDVRVCQDLVQTLSKRKTPVTLITPLAYGVGKTIIPPALFLGLPVVTVLCHGLGDPLYPSGLKGELLRIEDGGGCVLTEYDDGTTPDAMHVINRTKTMASLADIIIVAASKDKGSGMIAGRYGASIGKKVYAIPGSPTEPTSGGCNRLIGEGTATILYDFNELLTI